MMRFLQDIEEELRAEAQARTEIPELATHDSFWSSEVDYAEHKVQGEISAAAQQEFLRMQEVSAWFPDQTLLLGSLHQISPGTYLLSYLISSNTMQVQSIANRIGFQGKSPPLLGTRGEGMETWFTQAPWVSIEVVSVVQALMPELRKEIEQANAEAAARLSQS